MTVSDGILFHAQSQVDPPLVSVESDSMLLPVCEDVLASQDSLRDTKLRQRDISYFKHLFKSDEREQDCRNAIGSLQRVLNILVARIRSLARRNKNLSEELCRMRKKRLAADGTDFRSMESSFLHAQNERLTAKESSLARELRSLRRIYRCLVLKNGETVKSLRVNESSSEIGEAIRRKTDLSLVIRRKKDTLQHLLRENQSLMDKAAASDVSSHTPSVLEIIKENAEVEALLREKTRIQRKVALQAASHGCLS